MVSTRRRGGLPRVQLLLAVRVALSVSVGAGCSPMRYTHGVPNLAVVTPGRILRGGQPRPDGWRYLQRLGVTTVVKLNDEAEGSDQLAEDLGMNVLRYPITPRDGQPLDVFVEPPPIVIRLVVGTLAVARGGGVRGLLYVHCTHGQDRTGLIVGAYRVLVEGATMRAAYREMIARNFHPELVGLLRAFQRLGGP